VECCGGQKFTKDESEANKFSMIDYCSTYMYAIDNETKKMSAIPYAYANDAVTADFANIKPAQMKCEASDTEVDMAVMMEMAKVVCQAMGMFSSDGNQEPAAQAARIKEEGEGDKEAIEKDKDNAQEEKMADESKENPDEEKKEDSKEEDKEKVEMSAKLEDLQTKFTALENECNELKEFKANILEQEKISKVEFALTEVSKTIPKDQIELWRNKVSEFNTIDAWGNALKAFAYNYLVDKNDNKKDGVNRMGLPTPTVTTKKGLWD